MMSVEDKGEESREEERTGGGSDDCGGLKNRGEHWDKPEEGGSL